MCGRYSSRSVNSVIYTRFLVALYKLILTLSGAINGYIAKKSRKNAIVISNFLCYYKFMNGMDMAIGNVCVMC